MTSQDPIGYLRQQIVGTWKEAYLADLQYHTDSSIGDILRQLDQAETLWVGSDGSVKGYSGGCAWVLATEAGPLFSGGAREWDELQDSYRMEAVGLLGAVLAIDLLHPLCSTRNKKIHFLLDNKSVVDEAKETKITTTTTMLAAEAPLLEDIRQHLQRCSNATVKWIASHQDKTKKKLSFEATSNVNADKLAGMQSDKCQTKDALTPPPATKVWLTVKGTTVHREEGKRVEMESRLKPLKEYTIKQQQWPIGVWELVDWDAHGRVAAKLSPEVANWSLGTGGLGRAWTSGRQIVP